MTTITQDLSTHTPLMRQYLTIKAEFPNINWIPSALEEWETEMTFDEVWFFNVLQHVIDPKACLEKAGKIAGVVRVFEPVDREMWIRKIAQCHWSFKDLRDGVAWQHMKRYLEV